MERFTSWIPTMIDAGAKGALLLVAIFVVTRLMRGASAVTRHVAWAAGIVVSSRFPCSRRCFPASRWSRFPNPRSSSGHNRPRRQLRRTSHGRDAEAQARRVRQH